MVHRHTWKQSTIQKEGNPTARGANHKRKSGAASETSFPAHTGMDKKSRLGVWAVRGRSLSALSCLASRFFLAFRENGPSESLIYKENLQLVLHICGGV